MAHLEVLMRIIWRIYAQSDAHRCVSDLWFRLLRKQASRSLRSEYLPSYFAENTSFNIFGEEIDGLFEGLVKNISTQTDKTVKQRQKIPDHRQWSGTNCGDGGNRTPVQQPTPRSSPSAVCELFLSPWHHADLLPDRLS